MTLKDGSTQVIELSPTVFTLIALPMGLTLILAALLDLGCLTMRAPHPFRPTHFAYDRKTLGIVYQLLDGYHP